MNESYITVVGRVVADPQSRTTRTGVPFAAFRLASTVRRVNRETGQYEDGGTSFYNVSAFRALGANVANSLKKGEPVVVHGRLRVNQWMRADNSHATSVEIDALPGRKAGLDPDRSGGGRRRRRRGEDSKGLNTGGGFRNAQGRGRRTKCCERNG